MKKPNYSFNPSQLVLGLEQMKGLIEILILLIESNIENHPEQTENLRENKILNPFIIIAEQLEKIHANTEIIKEATGFLKSIYTTSPIEKSKKIKSEGNGIEHYLKMFNRNMSDGKKI